MKKIFAISLVLIFPLAGIFGQKERKLVREGVEKYQESQYSDAEVNFRKALDAKPSLYEGEYNIANTLYKQKKYEEAANEYENLIQSTNDPKKKADLLHNLGNSRLMAQQYDKGIDAYKNALRLRPEDDDTRYNLAYALAKMQEQQQQQKNDQNKDQKQDQKNEDQQNKQDQEKSQQNQQQNQQNEQKEDQKKDQQEQPGQKLNQQEVEQMLNAVQNQEKEVKEKVDKKNAVARPVRTEKDW